MTFFGLRRLFCPIGVSLSVSDRLGQHLAQLGLCLRGRTRARCLPLCHSRYVGMRERELKPAGHRRRKKQGIMTGCVKIVHVRYGAIGGLRGEVSKVPAGCVQGYGQWLTGL